ncbi:MAG TPA: tetratricopeptide repeat protein [Burkholderiales bacterium]|nr:tetratricopeptide repeat protein [Burkholderiales bacterium]
MAEDSSPLAAALSLAEACLQEGRFGEAEAGFRALLRAQPGRFAALVGLGGALELQGRRDEAITAYEAAIAIGPGHAIPFTRRAVLAFRRAFGEPPPPRRPNPEASCISMTTLGANGRFGNQLLQYGFLRMYAAAHGLEVEAPDWIGRDLFDLDDPLPEGPLQPVSEEEVDLVASLNGVDPAIHANADLWGYCCYPTASLSRHRALFRGLFRPGRRVRPIVAAASQRLREAGETLVAVHLRRGDFGGGRFWVAPAAWYGEWLEAIWGSLRRPVLYVATDDPAAAAELAAFSPLTSADLRAEVPGAEFYVDFHVLTQADRLAISNSSFSFVAAMLNEAATAFARPRRDQSRLAPFDPWDAEVLL